MPIAAIVNLVASSNSGTGPYTTLSFTPPTNQLQLIFVVNSISTGTAAGPPVPTLTGNSLTWTLENTVIFHTTTLATCRLSVYRALGTPTTGAITITPGGSPNGAAWMGVTITGADTSGVNGAGAIGQETSLGQNGATSSAFLTFGTAFVAGNGAIVAFAQDNTNTTAITPAGGWTEASEVTYTLPSTRLQVQWIATGDTTPDATWGGIAKNSGAIGLELKIPLTVVAVSPFPDQVDISDTPLVQVTSNLVWNGTINLLDQPKLLETITLSDVPIVTTSTVAGPRTFSSTEPLTLTDSPTLTGLILSSLIPDTLTLSDVTTLRGLTLAGLGIETIPLSDTPTVSGLIQPLQTSDVLTLSETPLNALIPIVGVLSRSVEEVLSLSEASTLQQTPLLSAVSETVSLSDSVTFQGLILARLVSDTISLTDSPTLQGLIQRLLATDVVTLTDLPATPSTRSFSVSETLTLADTPELELFAPITDLITLSDVPIVIALTAVVVRSFSTTDPLTLSDSPVLTGLLVKPTIQEGISLTDLPTLTGLTVPLSLSESLTLSDSSVLTGLIARFSSAETLSLTEPVSLSGLTVPLSVSDAISLSESTPLTGLTLLWTTTDALTLSDTPLVIRALEGVWQATTSDSLTLSETITLRGLTLVSSVVDPITTSDVPLTVLGAVAPRTFTTADPLTLTDTVLISGLALPVVSSDTLTLTEAISITGLIQHVVATDFLTVSDAPNFSQVISRTETVTLTDTATVRGLTPKVLALESLALTDLPNVFAGRRASDLIALSDVPTVFTIGGIITQPILVATAELRDLTKVLEIAIDAATAELRDLSHDTDLRQSTAVAELRNLLKTLEITVDAVTADMRDLAKTA